MSLEERGIALAPIITTVPIRIECGGILFQQVGHHPHVVAPTAGIRLRVEQIGRGGRLLHFRIHNDWTLIITTSREATAQSQGDHRHINTLLFHLVYLFFTLLFIHQWRKNQPT